MRIVNYKLSITFFMLFVAITNMVAQKTYNSTYQISDDRSKLIVNADLDKKALILEDAIEEKQGSPYRLAILLPLLIDTDSVGFWIEDGDHRMWTLSVKSPEAHGLILYFDRFYIPNQGQLFVYSKEFPDDVTIYDIDANPYGGKYSVEISAGDEMVLEYIVPKKQTENPSMIVNKLGYKYKPAPWLDNLYDSKSKALNDSRNSCIKNINCSEGNDWQNEKKGIVRLLINIGDQASFCSGSLINNVREDKTPYILTAAHCINKYGNFADFSDIQVDFNYEHPSCNNISTTPVPQKMFGTEMLARSLLNGGSDFALLKLKNSIPESYNVYFNGWTLVDNGNEILKGSIIHHPQGDAKKITLFDTNPKTITWTDDGIGFTNGHWEIRYSDGVTQGGSSGSPMFNQEHLIVGTLTGGSSYCHTPTRPDKYGKFSYHWDKESDEKNHLRTYLDPDNTGMFSLAGYSPETSTTPVPTERASIYTYWDSDKDFKDNLIVRALEQLKKVKIVNMLGIVVYENNKYGIYERMDTVNTSAWKKGIYIVMVETKDGKSRSIKIVK